MIDPTIREQSYQYFLLEAPELLGILEQELLSLRENYTINKVHNLMRTTHTLKGAAASIGLETIKSVAHSLEDIFKALFSPDVSIDAEVEALLFEGYECLRLPLTATLTGGQVNDAEILDRTAAIFALLQEKLGDCFSEEAHIPSSVELGFDVTQSIFEVGVAQRLDEIAAAIGSNDNDPAAIVPMLRTQAEVFLGLGESLNLPGFTAIAQAVSAALDNHPEQAVMIAQMALADFRAGQAAVLDGDRDRGGQPSLELQELAGLTSSSTEPVVNSSESVIDIEASVVDAFDLAEESAPSLDRNITAESLYGEFSNSPRGEVEIYSNTFLETDPSEKAQGVGEAGEEEFYTQELHEESANRLLEDIWGGLGNGEEQEPLEVEHSTSQPSNLSYHSSSATQYEFSSGVQASNHQPSTFQPSTSSQKTEITVETLSFHSPQTDKAPTFTPPKDFASRTVRVNVEHLEHLNYSIGELLTNQNRQSLQNEQLHTSVKALLSRFQNHRQRLGQLQDLSDRRFFDAEQWRLGNASRRGRWGDGERGRWGEPSAPFGNKPLTHSPAHSLPFDSLELDSYSEAQILVQLILEDAVQLAEAAEAIELFAAQSNQTLDKQRRLLTSARDSLMEARMLPLGDIFGRFPRLLEQLQILHNKPVGLELRGSEVLVDKVVAEKLYEPLLHLVRNAFDHGIESPALRAERGKPEKGQIEICAYHRGKYLMIEVRDDGQGLNFEKIRQRAVERQRVDPQRASALSENQLTDLLFEPGFSTASGVNDLSGRGIGLDVVRVQLQALQGSVTVHSQLHGGTTFSLQIPLSLTISKLLVFQAGERVYALLSDAIEQIVIPQSEQLRCWEDGKVLRWGQGTSERLIPIYSLATVLDYASPFGEPILSQRQQPVISETPMNPVILIRSVSDVSGDSPIGTNATNVNGSQDELLGLEVNQLMGEQELVIRPLGTMIAPPSFIYGGSILADGQLTLVLDGAALMQYVRELQLKRLQVAGSNLHSKLPYATGYALSSGVQPSQLQAGLRPASLTTSQQQPLLPPSNPTTLPASPASAPYFRTRQHKIVLVVDDSITVRQALALTLQQAGFQVFQAKDGYEAIEQLRQRPTIQLVLCDIEMPRMNGFEFLKYRQQDSALVNIPVVILTSRSGEKHRLIAMELGSTDYITKPYLEHELLATVNEVLEKKNIAYS